MPVVVAEIPTTRGRARRGPRGGVLRRAVACPDRGAAALMAWRSTRVLVGAVVAVAVLLILVDMRGPGPDRRAARDRRCRRGSARAGAGLGPHAGQASGSVARRPTRPASPSSRTNWPRPGPLRVRRRPVPCPRRTPGRWLPWRRPRDSPPVPGRVVSVHRARIPSVRRPSRPARAPMSLPGLAVIGAAGLAGIVDSVSPQVSTVRLVVDPSTEIAARVASSGEVGVFRGTGSGGRFELLDPLGRDGAGDLIVTLGDPGRRAARRPAAGRRRELSGSAAALTRAAEVAPGRRRLDPGPGRRPRARGPAADGRS